MALKGPFCRAADCVLHELKTDQIEQKNNLQCKTGGKKRNQLVTVKTSSIFSRIPEKNDQVFTVTKCLSAHQK